jgi:hypothetical protein
VANSGTVAYRHNYAVVVATIDEVDDGEDPHRAHQITYGEGEKPEQVCGLERSHKTLSFN